MCVVKRPRLVVAGVVLLLAGVAVGWWLLGAGSWDSRATLVGTGASVLGLILTALGFVPAPVAPSVARVKNSQVAGPGALVFGDLGSQVHSAGDSRVLDVEGLPAPAGVSGGGSVSGVEGSQVAGPGAVILGDMGNQSHGGDDNRQFHVTHVVPDERLVVPPKASVVVGVIPRRPGTWVDRPELGELDKALGQGGRAVVCAGRRGVGKTVLAAVHAQSRVAAGDGLVAWVPGETVDALLAGYALLGAAVGRIDPSNDPAKTAGLVLSYLNGLSQRGLLVVDNAENPTELELWLPSTGACRVLVTTNDHGFEQLGVPVPIDRFSRVQSISFLQEMTDLRDPDGADLVAKDLEDLALALTQAAAVITSGHLTFKAYLDELATKPLSSVLPRTLVGYPRGFVDALGLSLAAAAGVEPGAKSMLPLVAVLDAGGVSLDLLGRVCADAGLAVDVTACVAAAERMALVSVTGSGVVIMHRLVARVLRDQLTASDGLVAVLTGCLGALAISVAGPAVGPVEPEFAAEVGRHATALLQRFAGINAGPDDARNASTPAWTLTSFLFTAGAFAAMVPMMEAQEHLLEKVLGPEHTDTLASRNNVANGYRAVGRYMDAIALDEDTLKHRHQVLGPKHPDTLTSRSNLAVGYQAVARYHEAIELHMDTLKHRRQVLGPMHPDTLTSRDNLAICYRAVGRYQEAMDLDEETLGLRQQVLGAEHLHTLGSRNSLANDYQSVGRDQDAVAMNEATLKLVEEALGPRHPDTLTSLNNLANGYQMVGRYQEAIGMHQQTLEARQQVLGPDHPDTLISRNSLASGYQAVGRYQDAIDLEENTLRLRQQVLGLEHPDSLRSRNNLANAYQAVGRHQDAISLHEDTLRTLEKVLGPEHPDTRASRSNLAVCVRAVGRTAEAEAREATSTPCVP